MRTGPHSTTVFCKSPCYGYLFFLNTWGEPRTAKIDMMTDLQLELAGSSAARGAVPLNYNHFKIPLLENLVMRAIRDA